MKFYSKLLLTGLFILSICPAISLAQGLDVSGWELLQQFSVEPYAKVGWRHIGFKFVVDRERLDWGTLEKSPLDLKLRDGDFWFGEVGFTSHPMPNTLVYVRAGAIAPRKASYFTAIEPEDGVSGVNGEAQWWGVIWSGGNWM